MFQGRRAWFSRSVSPGPRELWAAGGGALAHWRDAEFLFSSDAAHPDTHRIHKSHDYLEGRATVFHSQYLSAWASSGAGTKELVALGHFILPPACLQEGLREKSIRVWLPGRPGRKVSSFPQRWDLDVPPTFQEIPNAQEITYLFFFLPQYSSEEETGSRAPAQQEFPHHPLQQYPVNNMVTGYASARNMKKYVGEIHYFIPGTSGYEVHWIQNEINLYSDRKTKTKRKL
ncbi:TERB2 protein, partial [Crotophaga sulcirostris]|nr:TERB2 protein [Crotophaga sulcirostris]